MDNEQFYKEKLHRCKYSHLSFKRSKESHDESEYHCVQAGWEDENVRVVNKDICDKCEKYKSRFIEYPITVSNIDIEEISYNNTWRYQMGDLCAIRPCGKEYEGKTYLGIYLGDLPVSHYVTHNPETSVLKISSMTNPGIYVLDLKKIIFGNESWWHKINVSSELKDITKEDIENAWYVKLLKQLQKDE